MNFGNMELFDILWRLCWAFLVGGTARFLRYWNQTDKVERKKVVKEFISGGFTGILAISIFNSDGNPFEIFAISATTGVSGVAWLLSKSDLTAEREKELLNKNKADYEETQRFNDSNSNRLKEMENDINKHLEQLRKEQERLQGKHDNK